MPLMVMESLVIALETSTFPMQLFFILFQVMDEKAI